MDGAIARASALHPAFPDLLPPLFGATIAPTRLRGSSARNVMPGRASVECDCRVLPGMTEDDLRGELTAALGTDLPYELEFLEEPTGGTIAPIDTPLFETCRRFVEAQDPGAILLPTISTGFTDSHFMRETFGTVAYGFWPCAAHADRRHARRRAQPRRAAARRRPRATPRGSRSRPAGTIGALR